MNPIFILIALLYALVFSGCTAISGGAAPVGSHSSDGADISMFSDAVTKGMARVQSNLHLAVENGDLKADDPAIPCVDGIVGTPNPNKKEYDNNGVLAQGSILYIEVSGVQGKQKQIGTSCQAIIGQFVIQGMRHAPIGGAILAP